MADRPSDSPEFKKKQARQAAQDTGSAIGAGLKRTFQTWTFYDKKKQRPDLIGAAIGLALTGAVAGVAYDFGREIVAPEPGTDTALEDSLRLGDGTGAGYQAFVANDGVSPIVLIRNTDGSFELYREIEDDGDRELTLVTSHSEAQNIMLQVSQLMERAAENVENGATGFTPYTVRYDEFSPAYKDRGDIQRHVELEGDGNRTEFSASTYRAMSTMWAEAANTDLDNYGFSQDEVKQLIEQDEHNAHFSDGFKYSIAGLLAWRVLLGAGLGVSTGVNQAQTRRRKREEKALRR